MEDNNINQNNQINNVGTEEQNSVPSTNQTFVQQAQTNNSNTNSTPKKSGPLVIFGIVLVIAIVLVVTLFFENKNIQGNESQNLINENTKTIIVYFSKDGENYGKNLNIENKRNLTEGNTKVMAERINSFIDADLFEIEPKEEYPKDLNELYAVTKTEYNKDIYPDIKEEIDNLDEYDVVFIGYPIWHASYPQIIKSFVRDNKDILKNKIIVPFNTHAGSGSAGTYKKLFNLIGIPEEKGLNGLAINGTEVTTSDENIKSWLSSLGYKIK